MTPLWLLLLPVLLGATDSTLSKLLWPLYGTALKSGRSGSPELHTAPGGGSNRERRRSHGAPALPPAEERRRRAVELQRTGQWALQHSTMPGKPLRQKALSTQCNNVR